MATLGAPASSPARLALEHAGRDAGAPRIMESLLSFFECIGTMNQIIRLLVVVNRSRRGDAAAGLSTFTIAAA